MQIEISSKHIILNEGMKKDIIKKFLRLAHFIKDDNPTRLAVHVVKTTGEHHRKGFIFTTHAKLYLIHKVIKAYGVGESVLAASDKAKEEIERQLLKVKAKNQVNKRRNRKILREIRGKI